MEATAGASPNGLPTMFSDWAGDESAIVTSENGITPLGATRMLRFISSANTTSNYGIASDIWQLVDMTPYSADISTGHVTATWSASFNRVAGNSQTEPQFYISLRAFSGLPADFPQVAEFPLAGSNTFLTSDADAFSWETIATSVLLPPGTTYIGVRIAARETINDSPVPNEFDGHYADQTSLNIVTAPEPTSLILVGTGVAIFRWRRKRPKCSSTSASAN